MLTLLPSPFLASPQIYRLDACKSTLVTRISSAGKWVPLHADQYDGEVPIADEDDAPAAPASASVAAGTVTLRGSALPWNAGSYELRYHHDGKHNVMARLAPLEIFVPRPQDPMSLSSVHEILTRIVTLALDSDSALVPQSALATHANATPRTGHIPSFAGAVSPLTPAATLASPRSPGELAAATTGSGPASSLAAVASAASSAATASSSAGGSVDDPLSLQRALSAISSAPSTSLSATDDPDDFTIMSAVQAERMVKGIRLAFDVDLTPAVVVGLPNVRELAERIVGSLKILARDDPGGLRARSASSVSASSGGGGGAGATRP